MKFNPPFVANDAYSFIISARVGGANQDFFIDNLVITSGEASSSYTYEGPRSNLELTSSWNTAGAGESSSIEVPAAKIYVNGLLLKDGIGAKESFDIFNGSRVQIRVPEYVYYDDNDTLLTDVYDDASYRYKANGITIANIPQTGNNLSYIFNMAQDETVEIQWEKQWAINVDNIFSATESDLKSWWRWRRGLGRTYARSSCR